MKRVLLIVFLSFLFFDGSAQLINNRIWGIYGGAGLSSQYNYNLAPAAGFTYIRGFYWRTFIGLDISYKTFSLRYDKEAGGATRGDGTAGVILKHGSSFVFISPTIETGLGRRQALKAYLSAGVGIKVGGFDTLRKWDHSYSSPNYPNNYDSTIDMSKNINSMLLRIAVGMKEYLVIGRHSCLTFTEDLGFIPSAFTKTGNVDVPGRNQYYPNGIHPVYISLYIGLVHTRFGGARRGYTGD